MTAGYPTNALADELGLKPGMRAFIADMPDSVRGAISLDELGLTLLAAPCSGIDAAIIFIDGREKLDCEVHALRQLIAPGGFIWAAWPNDAPDGEVNEAVVREAAAASDLAGVKSCTIDQRWSGLKLMLRKELP